ncbi:male sterility protein-domain-containing protein [Obelidium mucronatum]|nr:male sterility protein-domain-containing protein [Obelidium mucronatum]
MSFDVAALGKDAAPTVLLTGANGFQHSNVRVICHVRAKTKELGAARVKDAVEYYHGKWSQAWPEPEVVLGDIDEPKLGVCEGDWEILADSVHVIIHNGAKVDFVLPYKSLRKTNVESTVEVLRLASIKKVKGVVFMSSASAVQSKNTAIASGTLDEVDLESLAGEFFFGYSQTKNVSEVLCQRARARGIPTVSVRVGKHSNVCFKL